MANNAIPPTDLPIALPLPPPIHHAPVPADSNAFPCVRRAFLSTGSTRCFNPVLAATIYWGASQAISSGPPQARSHRSSRSEESRLGKELVSTCSCRWSPDHSNKKKIHYNQK